MRSVPDLDETDRRIALYVQEGLPLTHAPFRDCAAALGLDESKVIERLRHLKETNVVTRIGPFFNAERMGGDFCLCAMEVPDDLWAETVAKVNAFAEVAHNYRRDHALNMWFVLAVEHAADVDAVARRIEAATGLAVFQFPKLREFFLEMKVPS
jgi:siroheme decarboxylase